MNRYHIVQTRNPPNSIFYPYPRRLHEQDRWGVQDAKRPKQNTYTRPVNVKVKLSPASGVEEEIAERLFFAASGFASQDLPLEHEDSANETTSRTDNTTPRPRNPEDTVKETYSRSDLTILNPEQPEYITKEIAPVSATSNPEEIEDTAKEATPSSDETVSRLKSMKALQDLSCEAKNEVVDSLWRENMVAMELSIRSQENAFEADKRHGGSPAKADSEPRQQQSLALSEQPEWTPYDETAANIELQQEQRPAPSEDTDLELETEVEPRTIHILGTGPTGKYIAHALAGLPETPPVTLLMHNGLLMQQWHEEGASIHLFKKGAIHTKSNILIESSANLRREWPEQRFPGFGKNLEHTLEQPETVIESLIVTTEGHITLEAISAIKHRLRSSSTICFIQDGLGVVELVNSEIFQNPEIRPSYMLGTMSHDLLSTERKFTLLERRTGKLVLNMAPRNLLLAHSKRNAQPHIPEYIKLNYGWTPSSRWLTRILLRAPELSAVALAETAFYDMQLQKLAINSIIGPLSVMYDCLNEELLYNYQISRSMNLLIKEVSDVLRRLPEISKSAKYENRFTPKKLERLVIGILGKTGKNMTQMLQAVRKGQKTDIDFYNGYLLDRARVLRIDCPHLEMMVAMVKGKQEMKRREQSHLIPFKV